jgi:hypothetical protein
MTTQTIAGEVFRQPNPMLPFVIVQKNKHPAEYQPAKGSIQPFVAIYNAASRREKDRKPPTLRYAGLPSVPVARSNIIFQNVVAS